ncbi:MAG TPA: hypothetical protein V6D18_12245 [Thermosynechococcaceae cyanobacterium]
MMNHLGQPIELSQENEGWVGIWWHPSGCLLEVGYFLTPDAAWEAVAEFIQRDIAVRSLLELVEDWREETVISDREYECIAEALVHSVLVQ